MKGIITFFSYWLIANGMLLLLRLGVRILVSIAFECIQIFASKHFQLDETVSDINLLFTQNVGYCECKKQWQIFMPFDLSLFDMMMVPFYGTHPFAWNTDFFFLFRKTLKSSGFKAGTMNFRGIVTIVACLQHCNITNNEIFCIIKSKHCVSGEQLVKMWKNSSPMKIVPK